MKRSCLNLIAISIILFFGSSLTFSQTPAPPTPAKTSTKKKEPAAPILGTIKGQVTAEDGRVLGNTVVLARAINGTGTFKTGTVDSEGRFVLEDVPAAVYLVFGVAPGYVDESTTVGDFSQLSRHLIGSDLKIRLIKGGVITGTVTNSKGEGLVGVSVRASGVSESSIFMAPGGGGISAAETDDRGVYRIFGLAPGQYIVDAGGSGQLGRFVTTGFEQDVSTFYPSSTYDTAVPVTVRAGEEATGIDIQYKGTEGHSISGKVLGPVDVSMALMNVVLAYAGTTTSVSMTMVASSNANRTFSFDGLADGDYDLSVVMTSRPTADSAAASRSVTIRGGDVTGIELVLAPLASIAGSIKLEPIAVQNKCDKRGSELLEIMLDVPRDDLKKNRSIKLLSALLGSFGASLNSEGEFSLRNLEAGTYRPQVKLPTGAWYVRSITAPSASNTPAAAERIPSEADPVAGTSRTAKQLSSGIWPGFIRVRAGAKISGLSIIVGQNAAGVTGRVALAGGKSVVPQDLHVHLVPAEPSEAQNVLRYFETTVEREGTFSLTNLGPGRYFIIPRITAPRPEGARPLALDPTARAALRREAEALNNVLELKGCQRATDLELPFKLGQ